MSADSTLRGFATVLAMLVLGACTTSNSGPVAITKVNPYHLNDRTAHTSSADPMIEFQPKRLLYGAVTTEEREDRYGYYFGIFWKSESRIPVTVRLDYRQASTGSRILSKQVSVSSPKRKNVTKFEVIGDEYAEGGKVTQWKVSILEGTELVAEYKSFLWKE